MSSKSYAEYFSSLKEYAKPEVNTTNAISIMIDWEENDPVEFDISVDYQQSKNSTQIPIDVIHF